MIRRKYIRATVEKLLREHRVRTAPVPVLDIASALGTEVHYSPAKDDLSGFIYRDTKNNRTIIGVNEEHHRNRQLFTVAHELGHFLLHDFDEVHVDRRFTVRLRNKVSSQGTDTEEVEANLFAAELLMPARFLATEIEHLDLVDEATIEELAERYEVSPQAMTFRLSYLGYVQQ